MKLETVYKLDACQSRKEICERMCKECALNNDLYTASDFWAGAMIEDRKQAKLIMQEYNVKSQPAAGMQNYCEAHAVLDKGTPTAETCKQIPYGERVILQSKTHVLTRATDYKKYGTFGAFFIYRKEK